MSDKFLALSEAICDGEEEAAISEVRTLVADGTDPVDIFSECVEPTLNNLGEQFSKMEIFLPDLIVAAEVTQAIRGELQDKILNSAKNTGVKGKAVICTVNGDVHDIGKNIVALMLQVNGIDVVDLGVDVPPVKIVEKAVEIGADLVCLSSLMMPSLPYMRDTIDLVKNNPVLKDTAKVMVGGGPVTQQWADANNADGYSDDAHGAAVLALELLAKKGA